MRRDRRERPRRGGRATRRNWKRRQHSSPQRHGDNTVITLTDLQWAGRGWRTTADALLALSAAAQAREHSRVAREERTAA
jgi:hypothetical protein